MNTLQNKKRLTYIDIMKGIGIVSVILGHYSTNSLIVRVIFSFHMPLFIFINGYFYKKDVVKTRILKSSKAYLRPYLFTLFLLIVIESLIAIPQRNVGQVFTSRLLSGIYALASNSTLNRPDYIQKIGAIWFLNALFIGTIYLSLILYIEAEWMQTTIITALIIIAMLLTKHTCIPLGLHYGAAFCGWLYIGMKFREYNTNPVITFVNSLKGATICTILWGICLFISWKLHTSYNIIYLSFPLYGLELISALCGIIVITFISKIIERYFHIINKVLCHFGRVSLWILCVYALDIEIWNKIPMLYNLSTYIWGWRMIFDISIALLTNYGYSKIKAIKENRKIEQNKTSCS